VETALDDLRRRCRFGWFVGAADVGDTGVAFSSAPETVDEPIEVLLLLTPLLSFRKPALILAPIFRKGLEESLSPGPLTLPVGKEYLRLRRSSLLAEYTIIAMMVKTIPNEVQCVI